MSMNKSGGGKEEWSSVQHALAYLNVADNLPHCTEGEAVLLDHVLKMQVEC
jgi:tRNA (cmo5U34)-methyltransferase